MPRERRKNGPKGATETPAPFVPYARIFDSLLDGVLVASADARIVLANHAAARVFDVRQPDLLVPIAEYGVLFGLPGTDGNPADSIATRALRGDVVAPVERLILTPRGAEKTIRTSAAPLRDDQGAIIGAAILVADVSAERREAERARAYADELQRANEVARAAIAERQLALDDLRERETELKLAQRIAHVGSWAWVVGTERIEASEEVHRIYGRDPAKPTPTNDSAELRRHYTPEGWARRTAAFQRALMDGQPWEREEQVIRPDGSRRWVHFRGEPERDATGRIAKLRGTIQDITERKQSEDALRESERRFRALADAMPQVVCVLAWDGSPEYVNPAWIAYSGLDLASTARAGWERVVHPEDVGAARECWKRARERRTVQDVEIRYRSADGGYGWFLCRLAPIESEEGKVVRFIGAGMNIDERRRTEALLQRANEQLREADERKNEFLGVLSHELRNPLAAIRNGTYVLQRTATGAPEAMRARQIITRQTDHLARLVDDLLDVTRISRGKVHLRREVVDARDVVRRVCEDHRALFEEGSIQLTVDLPDAPVWVDADPTRIGQVIANILNNACKFTPPHGSVAVRLWRHDGEAEIRVRDTGLGMEPHQIHRMFEAFVQEDRTLARTRGGLGLGLALSKGLVELHGGRIRAHSEGPGKGSEFEIAIPVAKVLPG